MWRQRTISSSYKLQIRITIRSKSSDVTRRSSRFEMFRCHTSLQDFVTDPYDVEIDGNVLNVAARRNDDKLMKQLAGLNTVIKKLQWDDGIDNSAQS